MRMNRRSFLKTLASAGAFIVAGDSAPARTLLVLGVREFSQVSGIEWILYETDRLGPDNRPRRRCVVRVTSTDGVQGWADFTDAAMPGRTEMNSVRSILLGRDVMECGMVWRQFYEAGIPLDILAAVDVALWDLLGRLEGKPTHALLQTRRQSVQVCAGTGSNLGAPQAYAEYVLACKEKGISACRIQPYIGSSDRDIAVYTAVRDAVGADYPCVAGGLRSYTLDEARHVGLILDELAYKWYESPMPEDDSWRDRYVALTSQVKIPVCAPVSHPDSYPSRVSWIAAKACDLSGMSVLRGGFTACMELASACEAAGIPLQLPDAGPDNYPHLQVIAATAPSLIEYFDWSSPSREPVTLPGRATPEPVCDEQGCVAIPQTPGMGVELDWKYIAIHRIA